jgi:two-component sensor histidine kinase
MRQRISSVFRDLRRDRPWLGIAIGSAFFSIAVISRWFLGGLVEGFSPMMFLPAILLAGLFGGIRTGLAVATICLLVAWIGFFPPYGTFILNLREVIVIGTFALTAALELYVIRILKVAMNDLFAARERSNTLFRELQHRVANNLQIVSGFLLRERKSLERGSAGALVLEAAQGRLGLMGRVHRRLHDPASVDLPLGQYIEDLCADLIKSSENPNTLLTVKVEPVRLNLESLMSVSLIIAEIATNSLKHAFRGKAEGRITIELTAQNGMCLLTIADNGCGFPPERDQPGCNGLGQGILESLASQLGGSLSFRNQQGATVRLFFPSNLGAA